MVLTDHVCACCGAQGMVSFFEAKDVPVNSCLLLPTEEQAVQFPRGLIALAFCKICGFISNVAFDQSEVEYSNSYEDQQSCSSTFNVFAQELAKNLVDKHSLNGQKVLEIGCGKGDFVALLCELGCSSAIGIDPAYIEGRIESKASNRLTFIKDYYSDRYADYNADLVCCRHTLEHIPNPADFVGMVRRAIGDRLDTVVFFEVPDVTRVLHELAFWDIYYEHCSYFSLGSLGRLFRSCNFMVTELTKAFDDQYLLIEAKPVAEKSSTVHQLEEPLEEMTEKVEYFSKHNRNIIIKWQSLLKQLHGEGRRTVIWGSGSKCVSFMTMLDIKDEIEYVVDINPHRHGRFIPGAGKRIMPPEFLKNYKPDITLVMNPIYFSEIEQKLDEMRVKTEIIPV